MKIAIPLYANRISPRFGYSESFLVVALNSKGEFKRKNIVADIETPLQIAEYFAKEGIDVVLSGGMDQDFLREFRLRNIEVIWGLIGEVEDVLAAYQKGKVFAGMGPCPPVGNRNRHY